MGQNQRFVIIIHRFEGTDYILIYNKIFYIPILIGFPSWPAKIKSFHGSKMVTVVWFNDWRTTKIYRGQMLKFLEHFDACAKNFDKSVGLKSLESVGLESSVLRTKRFSIMELLYHIDVMKLNRIYNKTKSLKKKNEINIFSCFFLIVSFYKSFLSIGVFHKIIKM